MTLYELMDMLYMADKYNIFVQTLDDKVLFDLHDKDFYDAQMLYNENIHKYGNLLIKNISIANFPHESAYLCITTEKER